MCSLLCVEAVKIRNMLEIVCVELARLNYKVGLNIIGELYYIELVAVLLENGCCLFKDLCVRCSRCCDLDGLAVAGYDF